MKILRYVAIGVGTLVVAGVGAVAWSASRTEADINGFAARVAELGEENPAPALNPALMSELPAPVQRYFDYVFIGPVPRYSSVRLEAKGSFRRPLTETFNDTTAQQTIAVGEPALVFAATTPVMPGVWARAYDFFAEGQMEMKAKVLSTLTVVDERETPELNQISLRRWLLESALYPEALLPGGPVTWEAIDDGSARAIVSADGLSASLVARFDTEGRMTEMVAEEDGDLTTPYHGSGEHVARRDYRPVGNQMIPFGFTISRMAGGELYPFWDAEITDISYRE
ncbi:DUF6544 family protein [Paracoccus sp. SCSIO 75233]|uniref:DUF6920 family protein n=1 Tax=Paracoccus sp. SCSIO 75233 TaxID=3017782 RepID=UPI0022EFFC4F|nr:DUF6544 family protein [Paracoccus sp. SCSIO 75233]WBU54635.1 hypothetical protein PAF12_07355 [Paracoccus sp. SCSIO 75233]